MSREREVLKECHRILADYVVDDESYVIAPLLERVSTILSQPEAEPDAYLVTFKEVTQGGQKRCVTIAYLEPTFPILDATDNCERSLISAIPLYAKEPAPQQHTARLAAVARHKGETPETEYSAQDIDDMYSAALEVPCECGRHEDGGCPHCARWTVARSALNKVFRQRDELRSENERLRTQIAGMK